MGDWKPEIRRKICLTCDGRCCTLPHICVALDREKAERRLYEYAYVNERVSGRSGSQPVLKKRKDGSCVYFDRDKARCSIYARRPAACRSWFCGKGTRNNSMWKRLQSGVPSYWKDAMALLQKKI